MKIREVNAIICSCGGTFEEVTTSDEQEERYGCAVRECCVESYQCNKCPASFTVSYEAPDYNDY